MNFYPIICAPMNRVSDLNLALAVHQSKCIPSFVIYNYQATKWDEDFSKFKTELTEYVKITGSRNFVVALKSEILLAQQSVVDTVIKIRPAYLEVFDIIDADNGKLLAILKLFRKVGIKIVYKMLGVRSVGKLDTEIDGVVIKGPDAAARVGTLRVELADKIKQIKSMYPHFFIIASGGITSSSDIKACLELGADAVSLGTVFALSAESSMSTETKNQLLGMSFADTKNIGAEHQNAIVFTDEDDVDGNHTAGLESGLKDPSKGHVFIGKAIDTITEIKTVGQIVTELTCNL